MSQKNEEGDLIESDYRCCISLGKQFSCYLGGIVFVCCALSLISAILGGIFWLTCVESSQQTSIVAALAICQAPSIPVIILLVSYVNIIMKSPKSAIVVLNISILMHLTSVIIYLILHSRYAKKVETKKTDIFHGSFWVPFTLAIIESVLVLIIGYESKVC